ncbi:DUF4249 family protein [Ekhidna sp.]|uniref:DUF4249 family protein n=1 Tax=Ekhidna sp. TaxID=2608089 RepID=UPI0032978D1D
MKKYLLYSLIAVFGITSCETEVDPRLDETLNILVIDAWLTANDSIQHINITRSQPYFDASLPPKVGGAIVTVTDLTDLTVYNFDERQERYTWESPDGSSLGVIGHEYELSVLLDGELYTSRTSLNPVPAIDSISFRLEEGNSFFDDLIFAEFFATDLDGINDTYWIKAWKNGQFLGEVGEINIAYDAAFSVDENNDGVQFIQPIRDGISPFDESRDEEILSPYNLPDTLQLSGDTIFYTDGAFYGLIENEKIMFEVGDIYVNNRVSEYLESLPVNDDRFVFLPNNEIYLKGDSVYVEIHSISNEAYFFMNQMIVELDREAGFGALFATPLGNVPTNIIPQNTDIRVAGFFNIASVSSRGNRLTSEDQIRVLD